MNCNMYKKGDIILVDLGRNKGSVQSGERPCLVVSNNIGNYYSNILMIAPITSKQKNKLPTHLDIKLKVDSTILCEQIQTISTSQVIDSEYGTIENKNFKILDNALKIALDIK